MTTWTATAVAAELRPRNLEIWRVVEAQHRISTNRLAEPADQARLEALIEEAKPALPPEAVGLHFLLSTPFRYGYPRASRFRRAGERPGIFYASEAEMTALAETAYWRLRFIGASPGLAPPSTTQELSSFTVAARLARAADLTAPPFDRDRTEWMANDYAACQAFAAVARAAGADAIRYASARDPAHRPNLAVLAPSAFAGAAPRIRESWHLRFTTDGVALLAAFPSPKRATFARADL